MKDAWDKIKIVSDAIKDNKPIIIWVLGTLISSGGLGGYFVHVTKLEKNQAVREVATAFQQQFIEKEIPVEVKITKQPDGTWKTEITEINAKLNKIDGKLTKTLKDFHGVE